MLVLHTKSAELFFLFSLYSISQTTHVKTYYYINKNNNNKKRDTLMVIINIKMKEEIM